MFRELPFKLAPTFQANPTPSQYVRPVRATQTYKAYSMWVLICDACTAAATAYTLLSYLL